MVNCFTLLQIRLRRLAKLGSNARTSPKPEGGPSSPSAEASGSSTPTEDKGKATAEGLKKINITPSSTSKPQNPFSQLGLKTENGASDQGAQKRGASKADAPAPVTKKPTPAREESIDEFADRTLTQIFRITVDPHRLTDIQGHKLAFLPDANQELTESDSPLKLTSANLDSALLEALNALPRDKPILGFLLPCFKRILRQYSFVKETAKEKREVLDEAKRLCISNSLFALTLPDLFG